MHLIMSIQPYHPKPLKTISIDDKPKTSSGIVLFAVSVALGVLITQREPSTVDESLGIEKSLLDSAEMTTPPLVESVIPAAEIVEEQPVHEELRKPKTIPRAEASVKKPKERKVFKKTIETLTAGKSEKYTNREEYLQIAVRYAKEIKRKYGVPVAITLGQATLESRWGESGLTRGSNNHFGIKCKNKRHRGCCSIHPDDTPKDHFKKYASMRASFEDYGKLVSGGRYKKLQKHGDNYRLWAYGLKRAGYATDPNYVSSLIGIIESNSFDKY